MTGRCGEHGRVDTLGDDGSAVVEFVYLAVLLMVPLVYLVLAVFDVQRSSYAAAAASREAARVYVTAADAAAAEERARVAAAIVLEDAGVDPEGVRLSVDCGGSDCLAPGTAVSVRLATDVALPFLPGFVADRGFATIAVSGSAVSVVDRFRGRAP